MTWNSVKQERAALWKVSNFSVDSSQKTTSFLGRSHGWEGSGGASYSWKFTSPCITVLPGHRDECRGPNNIPYNNDKAKLFLFDGNSVLFPRQILSSHNLLPWVERKNVFSFLMQIVLNYMEGLLIEYLTIHYLTYL